MDKIIPKIKDNNEYSLEKIFYFENILKPTNSLKSQF